MAVLARRIKASTEPVYADIAPVGATVGLLGNAMMRHVANAALEALGVPATRRRVWNFAWRWWYQRTLDELLAYQIDRLTPDWLDRNVVIHGPRPAGGCILISIHQFNQHIALARAATIVKDLGAVSMLDPRVQDVLDLPRDDFLIPRFERVYRVSRFHADVFGERMYPPRVAARQGLELLFQGGSLIVLSDFYGAHLDPILGRRIPVADGPIWWAQRSGRPIVPFLLAPPPREDNRWQLIVCDAIEPTRAALVATLEKMIRELPTTWMSWRGWHASPRAAVASPT